jgi:rubrerythrin
LYQRVGKPDYQSIKRSVSVARKKEHKDKEHEARHKVYKAGDKYHCGECGAELVMGKDCPGCKTSFDWLRIMNEAESRH